MNRINNKKTDVVDVLNSIKIALYIIAVIFFVNTVVEVININTIKNLSFNGVVDNTDNSNEEELPEYDVSKFNSLNYKELKKVIKEKGTHVVYMGRESCGYCAMFIPVMVEAQEKYGFETYYFDITQVYDFSNNSILDQTAHDEIVAIDDFFEENFLATPMIAVFKDGKYVDGTLGYQEIDVYSQFLEKNNFKQK